MGGERFHMFGMAGRGMAPLAVVARHLGAEVSGCDRGGGEEIRRFLRTADMGFETSHSADHVVPGTTVVATSVAAPSSPEIRAAQDAGVLWHRTDLLAAVLQARPGIGVTGSHGKGTVAALTGAAMAAAGLDPLVALGVPVPAFDGMVRLGEGPTVAEVDDSDLSLRRVGTEVAVVTNLDDDHPHLDSTLREAVAGVGEFVSRAQRRVILGPSPRADRLESYAEAQVWRAGRDFSARTLERKGGETRLELCTPDGLRVPAVVRLMGPKTALNASLAFAAALALGAEPHLAAEGLGTLTSIYRRLEPVGNRDGVQVFDDFGGKHPAAVRLGISTLRQHFPEARITAVFEPYGPYLPRWGRRYARALSAADRVVLAPPVFLPDYEFTDAVDERWVDACSTTPHRVDDHPEAVEVAMGLSGPGDVVVFFAQVARARAMAMHAVSGGVPA
jgi:UDP-N-acetylmuramate--alanine ligase